MSTERSPRPWSRRLLKALGILLAIVAVVVLLFTVVFPWFDRTFVTDPVVLGPFI